MKKLIGQGKTAQVYSDNHYAYKVFNENVDIRDIEYEVHIQNVLCEKTSLDVCHYELDPNNHLIKMSLIDGISLADRIKKEKYKDWLKDMIDIQKDIYQYTNLDLPSAHEIFKKRILNSKHPQNLKEAALESLRSIEHKKHLCHLDLHPLNIMFENGTYKVIDWVNAKNANPILDIARTYVIFKQYIKRQANKYLRLMCASMAYAIEDVKKAIPLTAFLRLDENDDPAFEETLIHMILNDE